MTLSIDGRQVDAHATEMVSRGMVAGLQAARIVRHYGQLVQTQAKANASGRPGPRAVTGDYRRSIDLWTGWTEGSYVAIIGTNKAQGRRLEFGFDDVDSLGRVYHQPPYPHFGPALDRWAGPFQVAIVGGITPW